MFYRNFVIENNHIEGAHPHGITVGEANGLVIRNNTVVKDPNTNFFKPRLRAAHHRRRRRAQRGTVTGNVTHGVPGSGPGWVISGNQLVG